MAEVNNLEQAKKIYATLCQTLDRNDWRYKKDEADLSLECGARGEDLPIEINIKVDAKRNLVLLLSHLPYVVPEDKRLDVAIAVSIVNNKIVDGCFDYDVASGHMFFRMTNSYIDSALGEDLFYYMLMCACATVDEYNDKFLMLGKGMISIEKFIAAENN